MTIHFLLALSLIISPQTGWALQPVTTLNNNAVQVNCDQFCPQFIPSGATASSLTANTSTPGGLGGGSAWSTVDDGLCSELGQATTTAFAKLPAPSASFPMGSCSNVTITPNVLTLINAGIPGVSGTSPTSSQVCIAAGKLKEHCLYHNSQVETQCMAYEAIQGGAGGGAQVMDGLLLGLDFSVAAICTAACVLPPPANAVPAGICAATAGIAGITEAAMAMKQSTGSVASAINSFGKIPGVDGASTAFGIIGTVGAAGLAGTAAITHNAKDKDLIANAQKAKKALACSTAVIFTVLGALRTADLAQMNAAANNACASINALFSTPGASGVPQGLNNANGSGGAYGATGGNSGAGSGGGTGSISRDQLQAFQDCIQRAGSNNMACANAAGIPLSSQNASTDSNLFTPTGNVSPLLKPLGSLASFVEKAKSQGASSALGSILPAGSGEIGTGLTSIANTAQKDGASLMGPLHIGGTYTSAGGGGGGGGNSKQNSGADALGSLFGGAAGAPAAAPEPNVNVFGAATVDQDIWHSDTKKTLFQIVSQKTLSVSNRIETFDPRPIQQ